MRRFMQRSGVVCFRVVSLCVASFVLLSVAPLRAQNLISNLPLPEHITQGSGSLVIDRGLQISFEGFTEPRLERARDRFLMQLSRETGILRWPKSLPNQPRFVIHAEHASEPVEQLGEDE